MKRSTLLTSVLVVAVFAAAWTTTRLMAGSGPESSTDRPTTVALAGARVALPGNVPATGEPELPSLARLHPRPGTAVQATGPFDDRFILRGLRFDGRSVTASATITSDVSEVLEFGALAGFYDAKGVLIGTGRFDYHNDESAPVQQPGHSPDEVQTVIITVPKGLEGRATSAAVGVPVLVNE